MANKSVFYRAALTARAKSHLLGGVQACAPSQIYCTALGSKRWMMDRQTMALLGKNPMGAKPTLAATMSPRQCTRTPGTAPQKDHHRGAPACGCLSEGCSMGHSKINL